MPTHTDGDRVGVAIVGAAGYSGRELVRILLGHAGARVVGLFGSGSGVETMEDADPTLRGRLPDELRGEIGEGGVGAVIASGAQVAFLATPIEASLELAPALLDAGLIVIDLSPAFRLKDAAAYERFYGLTHPHPALLATAAYGLAERNVAAIATADLIANPGCYPTATALGARPLVEAGAIETTHALGVSAVSGVSGAGRGLRRKTHFCEVSLGAYGALSHRHTPEIEEQIGAAVSFAPHIAPFQRGLVSTIHGRLSDGWGEADVRDILAATYAHEPFVRTLPAGAWASVAGVERTNFCDVSLAADIERRAIVVSSAIDNLMKGAAGQAVQCFNIRFGLPETIGLLPSGFATSATTEVAA